MVECQTVNRCDGDSIQPATSGLGWFPTNRWFPNLGLTQEMSSRISEFTTHTFTRQTKLPKIRNGDRWD